MSQAHADRYCALLGQHYRLDTVVVAEGCSGLPSHLKGWTTLAIGLNLPVQVNPLRVEAAGITAGLSFGRRMHEVFIPWSALIGVNVEQQTVMVGAAIYTQKAPAPQAPRPVPISRSGNVIRVDFASRRRVS